MSRRWLLSLLCLSAALVFIQHSGASNGFFVNESATKFLIQDQTTVVLEVVNPVSRNIRARLKLELLDPKDSTRGLATRDVALEPGINRLSIPLALTARSINDDDDRTLPWYRLRYRIDPWPETKPAPDGARGVISLSEIDTPNIFALDISAPGKTHRGAQYHTHIRTFNPISATPVKDVNVSVELKLDDAVGEQSKPPAQTPAHLGGKSETHLPSQR